MEVLTEQGTTVAVHDLGGDGEPLLICALQTQATYGDVFTTAYLYEPIVVEPGRPMPNPNPMAISARARTEVFASKEAALWHYANRTQLGGLTAASLAAFVDHGFETLPDGRVRLKCRAEWEARTFEATGGVTTETVAGVSIPVVVAVGDEPDSPLVSLGPAIIDALEDARLLVYHRFGHFGPLQPPRRIVDDVFALTGGSGTSRPWHSSADS